MSKYSEFFLNSPSRIVRYETVEISHPNFTKIYRIIRNNSDGVYLTIEDGTEKFFEYYPLLVEKSKNANDLEQEITVTVGDLGEIIPMELENIKAAGNFGVKPKLIYREYRSDDKTTPILGPLYLEISKTSSNRQGSSLIAQAPALNLNLTGRIYSISGKFRTLLGFL